MEELLRYLVESLVDNKECITISTKNEPNAVVFEVHVAEEDTGKIIGKNGKIAQAIRAILHSASHQDKKKYILKIK